MNFTLGLYWFILACWVFWLIVYWRGGTKIVGDIQHALASGQTRLDSAALLTIVFGSVVLVGTGFALVAGWLPTTADVVRAGLGAVFVLIGMLGTFYCRHYLGRMWAANTTLQTDHHIVDSGPYAIVRHPIYTVVQFMYIGTTIAFLTWWTLVVYVIILIAHVVKTAVEDRFLAAQLPGYAAYQQRVRYRLIPRWW